MGLRGPKPGGKKGGRQKGAKNRMSMQMMIEMAEAQKRAAPLSPLEFMLQVLGNEQESFARRAWAAEKAAPYVHRRMPLAIEGGDPARPVLVATAQQLRTLSAEEFALLQQLSPKLKALPSPDAVMQGIAEHVAIVEEEEKDGA